MQREPEHVDPAIQPSDPPTRPSSDGDRDASPRVGSVPSDLGATLRAPPYRPSQSGRARAVRRQYPRGAYYNLEHASTGVVISHKFFDAGDPRVPPTYAVIGGPYADQETAIARARPDTMYPHLLRQALKAGILRAASGHTTVSLALLSEWTGFGIDTMKAWMRPKTSTAHRTMPRSAIRLILHEFKLRDQSKYAWDKLLELCR